MLPAPTAAHVFGRWTLDVPVTVVLGVLGAAYLAGLWRLRREHRRWPVARTAAFFVAGLGSVAVVTMSGLATYAHVMLWPLAVQVTALLTICPALIGFGDPLGLLRESLGPAGRTRYEAVLASRVTRALTFPVVPALLGVVLQIAVFFTGFAGSAARDPAAREFLYLLCLAVGCLFALPMLGVELLPAWCTQPVRLLFASVDGLLDAIPGIAVVGGAGRIAGGYYAGLHLPWSTGTFTDRQIAGGLMITVAEVVAAPMIIALFIAWIREDERNARAVDVTLDAAAIVRAAESSLSGGGPDDGSGGGPALDRPWWETDPGPLQDRAARYGWTTGAPQGRDGSAGAEGR